MEGKGGMTAMTTDMEKAERVGEWALMAIARQRLTDHILSFPEGEREAVWDEFWREWESVSGDGD